MTQRDDFGIPHTMSQLAQLRLSFQRNQPLRSADLAKAIGALETTTIKLSALQRQLAYEEYQKLETASRQQSPG